MQAINKFKRVYIHLVNKKKKNLNIHLALCQILELISITFRKVLSMFTTTHVYIHTVTYQKSKYRLGTMPDARAHFNHIPVGPVDFYYTVKHRLKTNPVGY